MFTDAAIAVLYKRWKRIPSLRPVASVIAAILSRTAEGKKGKCIKTLD